MEEIIEIDIEGKKRELNAPVANWCMQAAFNRQGKVQIFSGAPIIYL